MDFFLTNSSFTGLPLWPLTRHLLIGRITFQTYQHCGFDGETEWETFCLPIPIVASFWSLHNYFTAMQIAGVPFLFDVSALWSLRNCHMWEIYSCLHFIALNWCDRFLWCIDSVQLVVRRPSSLWKLLLAQCIVLFRDWKNGSVHINWY